MSVIEKPRVVPRVALVGGETPLGAEMRDVLRGSVLGGRVKLIGSEDTGTVLTEEGGEPVVITALDADELNAAQVVFFAGSEAASRKAFGKIEGGDRVLIDLSRGLEDMPGSRIRAPLAEPAGYEPGAATVSVVAHPAAIMIVALLRTLASVQPVARAVATAFEPASERGKAGIEEMHQQTMNLLAFQPLTKVIYDEQVAFNLMARYGEEAREPLAAIEDRMERHVASLTAMRADVPLASMRLLQAPVMHGTCVSLWLELGGDFEMEAVTAALEAAGVDVRGADVDGPNPVGMAAQGGIAVGSVARDRNQRRALWLFAVADNYRLVADNALAIARGHLLRSVA
jgi:aspartate-semialdehyde dehydrogenase